jgi:hypothetical protein
VDEHVDAYGVAQNVADIFLDGIVEVAAKLIAGAEDANV